MGWDRGRYYTRSRKVAGRVVREYVGTGAIGRLAAEEDAATREAKRVERAAEAARRAEIAEADGALYASLRGLDTLSGALLALAGFYRHHRGAWRRRRKTL